MWRINWYLWGTSQKKQNHISPNLQNYTFYDQPTYLYTLFLKPSFKILDILFNWKKKFEES